MNFIRPLARIALCNVPIRTSPTNVPPYGMLYIRQALLKIGCEVDFYNFDFRRFSDQEILELFSKKKYDFVGISAVVSTSYFFVKKVSQAIKESFPETYIVVGGNLAANSEVVLKFTKVDFCVIGDGEVTMQKLVKYLMTTSEQFPGFNDLKKIKGISYLDNQGKFFFTGYRDKIAAADIDWPDYSPLEVDGSIDHYFPSAEKWFSDRNIKFPKGALDLKGARSAWLPAARGCISRCTFCHRFEKGYRMRPVDQITEHARMLRDKYNVRLVSMFDESFGADKKSTIELISNLSELGFYWSAGSVRAKSIDDAIVSAWVDRGCVQIICGIESGSQDMLDIMEKKGTVKHNIDALIAMHKHGLPNSVMMVLGMPGETDGTVNDSIKFIIDMLPYFADEDRGVISGINLFYAQALPGTPLYETYRDKGLIGPHLSDEEDYLRRISNINAVDVRHYINGTDMPMIVVLFWRDRILYSVFRHYAKYYLKIDSLPVSLVLKESFYRYALRKGKVSGWKESPFTKYLESIRTVNMGNREWASAKTDLLYLLILNKVTKPIGITLMLLRILWRKKESRKVYFGYVLEYLRWVVSGKPGKNLVGHGISLRKTSGAIVATDGSDLAVTLRKGR